MTRESIDVLRLDDSHGRALSALVWFWAGFGVGKIVARPFARTAKFT